MAPSVNTVAFERRIYARSHLALAAALLWLPAALAARAGEGDERAQLVEESCRICHARELVDSQRLAAGQWRAEVEKMVRWGAPLEPEEIPLVTAFLAERLPPALAVGKPPEISAQVAIPATAPDRRGGPFPPKGSAHRGKSAYARDCASCHGADALGEKGPELVLRPVLDRPANFWEVVLHGRHRMPSFEGALPAAELADVYAFLQSLREPLASATSTGR